MPGKFKYSLSVFVLLIAGNLFLSFSVFASALAPNIRPFSPRIQAMGGAFSALADDANALHYNPAGLARKNKFAVAPGGTILSLIEVAARLRTDVLAPYETSYLSWIKAMGNPDQLGTLELEALADEIDKAETTEEKLALFDEINGKKVGLGLQGPLNVAYIADGWGFSFNAISMDASASIYEKILPQASLYLSWSTMGKIGYAMPVELWNQKFLAGVVFKYQSIAYIDRTGVDAISADLIEDSTEGNEELAKELIYMGQGPGLDWGLIWFYSESLDFSASLLNAVSYLRPVQVQDFGGDKTKFMAPILIFGLNYHPPEVKKFLKRSFLGYIFNSVKLVVDYETDFGEIWSFWKSWHLGTEIGMFANKGFWSLLYLRGGINQGYFTWGFGLDLYVLKLDYAYYQEELGPYPGNLLESSHNVSLRVEW